MVGVTAGEERKWSRREENTFWIVDFGKKLGLQSKKNKFDEDGLLMWIADVDSKEYFGK